MPMPPALMVAEMVRQFSNRLDWPEGIRQRATIASDAAPTQAERQMLQARRDDVVSGLVPATRPEIGRLVASLRAVMPAQGGDDAELTINLYLSALAGLPLWALDQVCRAFLAGKVPGHEKFAPTPDQIASRARALIVGFESEIAAIDKIVRAEIVQVMSPEERERMGEKLRALSARIGESSRLEREAEEEAARKRMAERNEIARQRELEAYGITDGIPMSVALRRKLGVNLPPQGLSDD